MNASLMCSLLVGSLALGSDPAGLSATRYAPPTGTFPACTHILFHDGKEIVTTGPSLYVREGSGGEFRVAPAVQLQGAHSTAFDPLNELYYTTDTDRHRMVAFRSFDAEHIESAAGTLAGGTLKRPHDVVVDKDGWVYVLNPYETTVFRFREFGRQESSLDLSRHLGYSRALTLVDDKLYVVGSSRGKVVQIDDFDKQQYRLHTSFGQKREASAGSWSTTGLVLNDVEFFDGMWYATSYFCPEYAAGTDCDENKMIRFATWDDFATGNWEDLGDLLPSELVPYYMTVHEGHLFLATFLHEQEGHPGSIYRISVRKTPPQ
ncbi:hypothetical protein Mal4_28490 [Maioricimonas rarisocia]|uniref:NHL repeat protein n=1 Tax=Maioricimonas rarisocia TaxID=2528026 RepID=A0A517Z7Q5_9PLAN|nr:hypothetical protein [Maioricimonas rarisocia]QDU38520.1 hypothetical protein Mal4_28490 [Maioricimonas rarisocia]